MGIVGKVIDYFSGRDILRKYKKEVGFVREFTSDASELEDKLNSIRHTRNIEMSCVLIPPTLIDALAITASVMTRDPKWLLLAAVGEATRIYYKYTFKERKEVKELRSKEIQYYTKADDDN